MRLFKNNRDELKRVFDSYYKEQQELIEKDKKEYILLLMEIGNIEYQFCKNIKMIRTEILEKITNVPNDISGSLRKHENIMFENLAANYGGNPSLWRLIEFAANGFVGCCLNPLDVPIGREEIEKTITENISFEPVGSKAGWLNKCNCNLEKICQLLAEKVSGVKEIVEKNGGTANFEELSKEEQICIENMERLIGFLYELCYIQLIVDNHEKKEVNMVKINEVVNNSGLLVSSIK